MTAEFTRLDEVLVTATTETVDRTGVEMEALTACAIPALAIVGACSARGAVASVEVVTLSEKTGGRSGTWRRPFDVVRHLPPPRPCSQGAR